MRIRPNHIIFFLVAVCLSGCTSCRQRKRINPFVSLRTTDKIPYGCFFAYDQLSAIFPKASISKNSESPKLLYFDTADEKGSQGKIQVYLIVERGFYPEKEDMESLIRFAASGHQLFISSEFFGPVVLHSLHLAVVQADQASIDSPFLRLTLPQSPDSNEYRYPGDLSNRYFSSFDSTHTAVLGTNAGKPDFIRIGFQHGGAIYVHLEPLAFTNFFLLHKENVSYYDKVLSLLPAQTGGLMWDDYFHRGKHTDFSALHFILSNRSLRWAFWLTVALFFLLYVVESKRKQRILLARPVPGNASVEFVKTIGRLYLQQKDNRNLAAKMIMTFLEQVRLNYNLPTSELNDEFSNRLALRTGLPLETVSHLIGAIHQARTQTAMTDQELMDLHRQMEIFNQPA